jgi:ABC-type sugar transport system ATPase subunit
VSSKNGVNYLLAHAATNHLKISTEGRLKKSILRTENLTKRFGSVTALSKADFSINEGEIRAIVGANGAGKSTFARILSGEIAPDDGDIYLNDQAVVFGSPKDSLDCGISMVPQDFGLIESMSVAENISLRAMQDSLVYRNSTSIHRAQRIFQSMSADISPEKIVDELSVSEKQLVAIAKALNTNSQIIIFDEPTSVLDSNSFTVIKRLLNNLRESGKSIIYVTHKLDEVFDVADSVSVFVHSEIALTSAVSDITKEDLYKYFNIAASSVDWTLPTDKSIPRLTVNNLTTKYLKDISFTVNAGESVGVVSDNHARSVELIKCVFGVNKKTSGTVTCNGKLLTRPSASVASNVGFIPEDRRHDGIFDLFRVFENISFLNFRKRSRLGILDQASLVLNAKKYIEALRIKCESVFQPIRHISGGNQQKVLLARWMSYDFDLLLLLEPTAGIDLGGKSEIHAIILELRSNGKSFLITSSDKRELERMCDKILVIKDGKIDKFTTTERYFSTN